MDATGFACATPPSAIRTTESGGRAESAGAGEFGAGSADADSRCRATVSGVDSIGRDAGVVLGVGMVEEGVVEGGNAGPVAAGAISVGPAAIGGWTPTTGAGLGGAGDSVIRAITGGIPDAAPTCSIPARPDPADSIPAAPKPAGPISAGPGSASPVTPTVGASGIGASGVKTSGVEASGVGSSGTPGAVRVSGLAGLSGANTARCTARRCTDRFGPIVRTTGRSAPGAAEGTGTVRSPISPAGSSGPVRWPSGARNDGSCQAVRVPLNRCTGFTSGCSASTRWMGGSRRHSARTTGPAGGAASRFPRHGHIAVHRP
ncbi:MAG TPA: hypothetical protein VG756_11265 [Pseudonocardiaceae bacterium]|nr:hypothetical protein [Pseudonocardiaceae bacterium]